jgi:hypothetical protein
VPIASSFGSSAIMSKKVAKRPAAAPSAAEEPEASEQSKRIPPPKHIAQEGGSDSHCAKKCAKNVFGWRGE